ncbi:MAG: B12-binding domain-containing radical SAM protein [Nanoarchaeota archaeon]|nr:B12-binding domain-containing radical SAM protein [Nanoarchaeota archaeon]
MNKKVLLVKPPQKTIEVQPPLGLGYLASTIKDFAEVQILDCIKEKYSIKDFEKSIQKNKFDIVGFQCYTVDLNIVKKLIKVVKTINPKIITFVGGPQPSLDPINSLNYLQADYGFCGEAEIGFPLLIKSLIKKTKLKKIPGLIYKDKNKIIVNQNKLVENLDDYQIGWEFFNLNSYPLAPHGAFCKQYPTAPLIITRGCPFQCTYCGAHLISGRKIRSHSVDFVIKQIEFLNKKHGIKEIHIEDDNFTMKKDFVKEFCNKLIQKNLEITFTFPNGIRLDTLDSILIKLMKKAGLYSVSVGIESGSDRILKLMNKNLTTSTIKEKINLLTKENIEVIGFFIVGYPGETISDINKTINFACSLPLKRATFSAFKPFPGTLIYNELIKKGELKELKYENFSLDKIAWSPKGISNKQLKNLRRNAFLKFYLRPKILFKMLSEIKNFQNFKFIIIRVFRWLT